MGCVCVTVRGGPLAASTPKVRRGALSFGRSQGASGGVMVRSILTAAFVVPVLAAAPPSGPTAPSSTQGPRVFHRAADLLFADDFSRGVPQWEVHGEEAVRVRDSGDPAHGSVLELVPNGDVLALIKGSDAWNGVRVEGRMLFPGETDNYLGLVYHAARQGARWDFGLVYVKGNDSYLQLNPHRDFNVSRAIYPEFRALLAGDAAVEAGRWQTFAFEVMGTAVHVYIGPSNVPQLIYDAYERSSGLLGLQPRSVGGPVWVDDVTVRAIDRLSHGPGIRSMAAGREGLLTSWHRAGPFERTDDRIAQHPKSFAQWSLVTTDPRGAIVTGRDVDYHGARTVAYYRAIVVSPVPRQAELVFGTVDDLAIWINGRFEGFVPRQDVAWFDVHTNPAHPGRRVPLTLRTGANDIVVRVRGGVYASGGFFSRLVDVEGRLR